MTNLTNQAAILNVLNLLNNNGVRIESVCLQTGKIVIAAVAPEALPVVEEEWKKLARQSKKIDAIRAHKQQFGSCLADAKRAVEAFMADEKIPPMYP